MIWFQSDSKCILKLLDPKYHKGILMWFVGKGYVVLVHISNLAQNPFFSILSLNSNKLPFLSFCINFWSQSLTYNSMTKVFCYVQPISKRPNRQRPFFIILPLKVIHSYLFPSLVPSQSWFGIHSQVLSISFTKVSIPSY